MDMKHIELNTQQRSGMCTYTQLVTCAATAHIKKLHVNERISLGVNPSCVFMLCRPCVWLHEDLERGNGPRVECDGDCVQHGWGDHMGLGKRPESLAGCDAELGHGRWWSKEFAAGYAKCTKFWNKSIFFYIQKSWTNKWRTLHAQKHTFLPLTKDPYYRSKRWTYDDQREKRHWFYRPPLVKNIPPDLTFTFFLSPRVAGLNGGPMANKRKDPTPKNEKETSSPQMHHAQITALSRVPSAIMHW